MSLKPGPKPIAKSTGKVDQRRRDNKDTPGNTTALKPSKKKWSIYFNRIDKGYLNGGLFYILRSPTLNFSA